MDFTPDPCWSETASLLRNLYTECLNGPLGFFQHDLESFHERNGAEVKQVRIPSVANCKLFP